jgi:hypothetical protein
MKIFLIIFIALAFNNTAFAIIPSDIYPDQFRCKVTYTQLDLITGVEKTIKITAQKKFIEHILKGEEYEGELGTMCINGAIHLSWKISDWAGISKTNAVKDVTVVHCKKRTESWFNNTWSKYKLCAIEYNQEIVSYLIYSFGYKDYNFTLGYNIHNDRVIGLE